MPIDSIGHRNGMGECINHYTSNPGMITRLQCVLNSSRRSFSDSIVTVYHNI